MPIYEYECVSCGDHFERRQSFSDEPIKVCPECGGATRKVLQPVGIVFKGSGWYITDSRPTSSSESSESKSDSKPTASAETKSEVKTETKGESTSAPKSDSAKPAAAPQSAK